MAVVPIIAPGVITQLQAVALRTFPSTVQIMGKTVVDDGRGGETVTFVQRGASVAGRLEPFMGRKGGEEAILNGRFEALTYWRVSMPAGTDVRITDHLQIGSRLFEIKAVDGPKDYEVIRRAFAIEVT